MTSLIYDILIQLYKEVVKQMGGTTQDRKIAGHLTFPNNKCLLEEVY
jgi:hypothetical protein